MRVLIVGLYYYTKPALRFNQFSKRKRRNLFFLILVFCLFSFWGADWFGYLYNYHDIRKGFGEHVPLEDVYHWIAEHSPYYLVFRLVIWGGALLLFYKTLNRLSIDKDIALFFFCTIFLIWFSYARVSLAIAMLCYGYSLLYNDGNKVRVKNIIIGIAIILLSFFFHKSAAFGIVAIIFSMIIRNMKRSGAVIVLLAFPLVVFFMIVVFPDLFGQLLEDGDSTVGQYAAAGNRYMNAAERVRGWGTTIQLLLEHIPYYLLAFGCTKAIAYKRGYIPNSVMPFLYLTLVLVVFSSVFLFNVGMNTYIIYQRFLRFAQIAACISLTALYQYGCFPKLVKWTYSIWIFSTAYSLIYGMYNVYSMG